MKAARCSLSFLFFVTVFIGPAILISPLPGDEIKTCGDVSPEECLKKLQTFLRLKNLPFTSQREELDKLCLDLLSGYNCSGFLLNGPNCFSNAMDKNIMSGFLDMAQFTAFMFCKSGNKEGYLKEAFLENSECVSKQKKGLACCAEQSKLPDLPVLHVIEDSSKSMTERQQAACCPVASYLKCVQTIVESECGDKASNFTAEYIRRASGESFEAICQKLPGYPNTDPNVCTAPDPVCAGCRIASILTPLIVVGNILMIRWTNFL